MALSRHPLPTSSIFITSIIYSLSSVCIACCQLRQAMFSVIRFKFPSTRLYTVYRCPRSSLTAFQDLKPYSRLWETVRTIHFWRVFYPVIKSAFSKRFFESFRFLSSSPVSPTDYLSSYKLPTCSAYSTRYSSTVIDLLKLLQIFKACPLLTLSSLLTKLRRKFFAFRWLVE